MMAATPTLRCPHCGRDNRAGARFCAGCGKPLAETASSRSDIPSAPAVAKEEAAKAAQKLWDITKTVVTVGGRTAWQELTDPPAALEGTLIERFEAEAVTPPNEPAFWGFVAAVLVLLVFALTGRWFFPLVATVVTLVLSWLRWKRPFFSPLAWKSLSALLGKPSQVPSAYLKVQTPTGEVQVTLLGERQGDLPQIGDRLRLWGIYEDKAMTKLRAWKVQPIDEASQPKGEPCQVPRLFPLIPSLFFASLALTLLGWLLSLWR
ncbi:MAG: hypothetical protein SLRJCFUN_000984 [Candidatus Fervidibacter sp.]